MNDSLSLLDVVVAVGMIVVALGVLAAIRPRPPRHDTAAQRRLMREIERQP